MDEQVFINDDLAKKNIGDILTKIGRKFEIIHARWFDDKKFEAKFRTITTQKHEEDYNAFCDQWVEDFSKASQTIWADKTSNTGPKVKFRKQYECWTYEEKKIHKELLFDPRRCKGSIDMKILAENRFAKRRQKHFRLGLNVLVIINFFHLHSVNSTEKDFSFFVHNCKPQEDIPHTGITTSSNYLPILIQRTIENGPSISQKATDRAEKFLRQHNMQPLPPNHFEPHITYVQASTPSIEIIQNVSLNRPCI